MPPRRHPARWPRIQVRASARKARRRWRRRSARRRHRHTPAMLTMQASRRSVAAAAWRGRRQTRCRSSDATCSAGKPQAPLASGSRRLAADRSPRHGRASSQGVSRAHRSRRAPRDDRHWRDSRDRGLPCHDGQRPRAARRRGSRCPRRRRPERDRPAAARDREDWQRLPGSSLICRPPARMAAGRSGRLPIESRERRSATSRSVEIGRTGIGAVARQRRRGARATRRVSSAKRLRERVGRGVDLDLAVARPEHRRADIGQPALERIVNEDGEHVVMRRDPRDQLRRLVVRPGSVGDQADEPVMRREPQRAAKRLVQTIRIARSAGRGRGRARGSDGRPRRMTRIAPMSRACGLTSTMPRLAEHDRADPVAERGDAPGRKRRRLPPPRPTSSRAGCRRTSTMR